MPAPALSSQPLPARPPEPPPALVSRGHLEDRLFERTTMLFALLVLALLLGILA